MSDGDAIAITAVIGGALALVGVLAFALARHPSVRRGLIVVLSVLTIILVVDVVAYLTDFRDADGAIDCSSDCSFIQAGVKWSASLGAYLLVVLVAALLVRAIVDGVRRDV